MFRMRLSQSSMFLFAFVTGARIMAFPCLGRSIWWIIVLPKKENYRSVGAKKTVVYTTILEFAQNRRADDDSRNPRIVVYTTILGFLESSSARRFWANSRIVVYTTVFLAPTER
mmetsp:Transcript_17/g.16  ORF Transcript_17/g.16 Transcript_17/m.16 type:complete len:114 (-) Transcript_17:1129-1470(-)